MTITSAPERTATHRHPMRVVTRRTGLPATIEGAIRSGNSAADLIARTN